MHIGECSAEIKQLQKDMNTLFGTKRLPEDGTFDEGTEHYLKILQKKLKVPATGEGDRKTLDAIAYALEPKTDVVVDGKTLTVTKKELEALEKAARAKAAKDLQKFVVMAKEAERYWIFHDQIRKDNWFSGIVDRYAKAEFPPKALMERAKKAAQSMVADALKGREVDVKKRSEPIKKALSAIQTYRGKLYEGGDDLVGKLETVRDTCEVSVQVMAAVSTGGASWYVQVGVAAGTGAYKGVMGEMRRAKNEDVTFEDIRNAAIKNAVIEGSVGLVMKGGGKGIGKFADDVAEEAVKTIGTGTAKKAVKGYAVRFVNGAGQKTVEDTMKLYVETRLDPKKKVTRDDLVKLAAGSVVGGTLKAVGPVADAYAKKASAKFDASEFLEVTDKARQAEMWKAGVEKAVEAAGDDAVDRVLKKWDGKKPAKQFEEAVRKEILGDRKVKAAVKKAEKRVMKKAA